MKNILTLSGNVVPDGFFGAIQFISYKAVLVLFIQKSLTVSELVLILHVSSPNVILISDSLTDFMFMPYKKSNLALIYLNLLKYSIGSVFCHSFCSHSFWNGYFSNKKVFFNATCIKLQFKAKRKSVIFSRTKIFLTIIYPL